MFRPAVPNESQQLVALAASTDAFQPGEAEELLGGLLKEFHAGSLGEGHQEQVWADDQTGAVAGWVYFAPSFASEGVWDRWWIGVDPASQGKGVGGRLLEFVESRVQKAGGRLLIIETSSTKPFDSVRRFYAKRDYTDCGRIPDFYAEGDDKVTFAKRIAVNSRHNSLR
ncbi:N-acetyltransferase [soil metagenome]